MKFLMSRNELSGLVTGLQTIVAQRTPMPILQNILVVADDDKVTFTATDLTVGVRCSGLAKVSEKGSTTIPARRFSQLLRELNVSYVEISTNEKEMSEIITDSSTFRMHGLPMADYPALPDLSGARNIRVKQCDLKNALFRTSFAVSKDENRYVLTGVSLSIQDQSAIFVGTDGKRMARSVLSLKSSEEDAYSCIIPAKAVDEIARHLVDNEEDINLYLMNDKIAVETRDCIVMTKLLAGEYPEVERVIPNNVEHVVALHKDELGSLLRQISLFIAEDNASVRFSLQEGTLRLAATTSNIGEGNVSMMVNYSGPSFEIAFNPLFFLDILKHSRGEYMYLGFQDSFNPVVLSDIEFEKSLESLPSPLFILMPLRLGSP